MTQSVVAALAGQVRIVPATDATALAELRHTVSDSQGRDEHVVVLIAETVPKLDRVILIAAIAAIAMEAAPGLRVCALDLAAGAHEDDIIAAARFLATARSSTGQVLRITARG